MYTACSIDSSTKSAEIFSFNSFRLGVGHWKFTMNRKIYYWKLRTTELQLGERTLVMGVLNITPDSFSDGGCYLDPDKAYARALEMEEQGVDIIDIGAESTRPESRRISADEEWQRLVPVLKRLRGNLSVPLSLDTYKSETAERALEYGVEILNDPSGLTFDAGLAKVAATGNAGLILNHMRGTPEMWGSLPPLPDVTGSTLKDLDATTSRARRAGVEKNRIVVDPGLGFGKRKEQNSEILAQLGRLAELDYPILAAPSRKAFLTHAGDGGEVIFASAAAVTAAILHGAHMVRVHDIKEMRAVVLMADEIARLGTVPVKADEEQEERQGWRGSSKPVSRPKVAPAYMGEEKHQPMRPPMMAPPQKPVVVPVASPAANTEATVEAGEPEEVAVQGAGELPVGQEAAAEAGAVTQPAVKPAAVPPASGQTAGFVRRPPQTEPSKGWGPPAFAPKKDFGDRPAFGAGGPRKEYGDRPSFGDRAPRKDFGDRGPRPPFGGDRGPRKDFGDRPARPAFGAGGPPRKDFGDRAPRKDFGDRGPRPPFGGDRGPRKDFGDRPSRPAFGAGGPPRKDFGDRGPRPPFGGDRGPRKDFGDRPSRPAFGAGGPPSPGGRPPQRPFRKRP
jgi:dihydropteroate synthase